MEMRSMKKTTEINLTVGNAIRYGLQKKNMTQRELADIIGSTQRSISSYINGNAQPPLDILSHICCALEINLNQILHIPDYNFPSRLVQDPLELAYLKILDGVPTQKRTAYLDVLKVVLSLASKN